MDAGPKRFAHHSQSFRRTKLSLNCSRIMARMSGFALGIFAMSTIEMDEGGLLVPCPNCGQRNRLSYERLGQTFRCGKCHAELGAPPEPIDVQADAEFFDLTNRASLPDLTP